VLDVDFEGRCIGGSLDAHRFSHPMQKLIEAISVRFLPLFLGTRPYALTPLGARDLRRSIEICVPLSSTNTSRLRSKRETSHRHKALAPSSRS
jgi:hypothetical protein